MDEKKELRTTLKLPFAGRVVRARPLNGDQMVAMSLLDTKNPMRTLRLFMRLLENQVDEAEWDDILADQVCGRATANDLVGLLLALSEGSAQAVKATETTTVNLPEAAPRQYEEMASGLSVGADA
ncbi:hypothetical protein ABZ456_29055 [Streptomyces sp. NPDC005776]|uniref:hypothetical protein n=1 Tax=Streptomyces sp. NPDC005776 TaxID=3154676 RepID=UPI0033F971A2